VSDDSDLKKIGTTQTRTAHSERVLREILIPTAAIIRTNGILGSSVDHLVDVIGVSKGTLYYHIRTKEGLLFWIHESVTNDGYARWKRVIEESDGKSATETLRRMIAEHCMVIHEYRDCVAVISEEMKYLPPDLQSQIHEKRTEYQKLLESVLSRGVASKEFSMPSVRLTASMMIGTLNSMYRWYSPDGSLNVAELTKLAESFLLNGLQVKSDS
jgi:TetR/AcrR family transcriptional regulator, cholesterol catabolism regulator